MIGNATCRKVEIHYICGKEARKLFFKEIKENRRNQKLKRLIIEVRRLRRQINATSN